MAFSGFKKKAKVRRLQNPTKTVKVIIAVLGLLPVLLLDLDTRWQEHHG